MMNMLGMNVFPFIGNPMIKRMGDINQDEFEALRKERQALIPVWIKAFLAP
jgi:hypothetical protein